MKKESTERTEGTQKAVKTCLILLSLYFICLACGKADADFTRILHGHNAKPGLILEAASPQTLQGLAAIQLPITFFAAAASLFIFHTFSRSPRSAIISLLLLLLSLTGIHELFHTVIPICSVLLAAALTLFNNYFRHKQEKQAQLLSAAQIGFQIKQKELLQTQLTLVRQQEEERRLFAGHLHDHVLAEVKELKEYLNRNSAKQQLDAETIKDQLNAIDREIRQIMENLYPSVLTHLGFLGALDSLTHESGNRFPASKFRLETKFSQEEEEELIALLKEYEKLLIYRFVQEALNNAGQHAQARTVVTSIALESADKNKYLQIVTEDDGIGMPSDVNQQTHSRGLLYMKTKASLLSASFSITEGREGKGTRVTLSIPLKDK